MGMTTFSVNLSFMDCFEQLARIDFRLGTELGREWAGETALNLAKGRINDQNQFNIEGYGFACDRNVAMTKAKREVALLDMEELENNRRGVANTVACEVDVNLERVVEDADVQAFVDEFLFMRDEILVDEGFDIWRLFRMGVCGCNKRAVNTLKGVIERQNIGEMMRELMGTESLVEALGGILR